MVKRTGVQNEMSEMLESSHLLIQGQPVPASAVLLVLFCVGWTLCAVHPPHQPTLPVVPLSSTDAQELSGGRHVLLYA